MHSHPSQSFGSCCPTLREALDSPHSTFRLDEGVLYLVVGRPLKAKAAFYDKAVFYCPFCGRSLQTPESIQTKMQ